MQFQEPLIVWLQTYFHPALDPFFKAITFLGGFDGVLLLWIFFVWCISYSNGCRLILVTQFAHYVGSLWLKALVALPRPYETFPSVIGIISEKGFAFPSGHALNAMLYGGACAMLAKNRWLVAASILFILLVGLSRIYLGVHYPTDVLSGYFLGAFFLWVLFKKGPVVQQWMSGLRTATKIAVIVSCAAVLGVLLLLWAPPGVPISWAIGSLGMYLGISFGWLAKNRWLTFEADGPWMQRITRFILGTVILYTVFHFGRHTPWIHLFSGFWISFGGPLLFQYVGLSHRPVLQKN